MPFNPRVEIIDPFKQAEEEKEGFKSPTMYTPEQLREYGTLETYQPPGIMQRLGLGPVAKFVSDKTKKFKVSSDIISGMTGLPGDILGVSSPKATWASQAIARVLPDFRDPMADEQDVLTHTLKGLASIPTGDAPSETWQGVKEGDVGATLDLASAPLGFGIYKGLGKGIAKGLGTTARVADKYLSNSPLWQKTGQVAEGLWDKAKLPMNYLVDPKMSITDISGRAHSLDDALANIPSAAATGLQYMGKGVVEALKKFQPAIERLRPLQQSTIRGGRAQENIYINEAEKLGGEISSFSLPDKLDVLRGLRGESLGGLSKSSAGALTNYYDRLKQHNLNPEFIRHADASMGKLLTGLIDNPQDVLTDPAARGLLDAISTQASNPQWYQTLYSTEGMRTRKLLRSIIENPAMPDNISDMARAVYELPAITPELATKAARESSNSWITKQLQQLTGADAVTSPIPLPGYLKVVSGGKTPRRGEIAWSGLDERYIKKDVGLELVALRDSEKWSRGIINRTFTAPWKTMKIILSPAAQLRNTFTNFLLNDIGGMPVYRMDLYSDAWKGMRRESQAWKDFVRITGGGGTFGRTEMSKLEGMWKYDTPWWEIPYKFLDMASSLPKSVYNFNEQLFKFAFYLHELEKGVPSPQAAWNALKPTFNYGEVTPAIGALRATVMPFATWTSKVIPYTIEQTVKHPLRVAKWYAMGKYMQQEAMTKAGITQEEWTDFKTKWPDWMQNGAYLLLPWRDERDRLNMLDLTYVLPGIGDIMQMTGQGIWEAAFQHPIISLMGELRHNRKFTGEPITYDWKPPTVQAIDYSTHIWNQLMPSVIGSDWARYARSMSEEPGAQTVSQAIAAQFGLRIQPLDEQKVYSMHQALSKIHMSEITTELAKRLRRATSEEEKSKIIEDFTTYRQDYIERRLNPKQSWTDRLLP